jgi:hypothetical protein
LLEQSKAAIVAEIQMGTSKNPDFIPTTALREKFLSYISNICGAAKWGKQASRVADARKFFPRLAIRRTMNF